MSRDAVTAAEAGILRSDLDAVRAAIEKIEIRLGSVRFNFRNEEELKDGMAKVLGRPEAFTWSREVVIDAESRLDFVVKMDGVRIAIEVKTGGSLAEVTRQVHRYAQHPAVDGVIVASPKSTWRLAVETFSGKPVSFFALRSFL